MMLQQARELLRAGQDWSPSGVLERQIGGTPKLPTSWPVAGEEWCSRYQNGLSKGACAHPAEGIWHWQGAWLKPAELVRAWLSQPGVSFKGNANIAGLRLRDGVCDLLDESGGVVCSAERVIIANAGGASTLLHTLAKDDPAFARQLSHLPAMQGMRGLLSWSMHGSIEQTQFQFPPFPVNGSGSVVSEVPLEGGRAWFMGSSYQPEQQAERSDTDNHIRNFEHLQQLLPALASDLTPAFAADALNTWKSTRCVTSDRLPLVGPLDDGDNPSLWICAGMGSRGMSFSVLCAELLAARMGAEPLPIEASLAKSLNALRA